MITMRKSLSLFREQQGPTLSCTSQMRRVPVHGRLLPIKSHNGYNTILEQRRHGLQGSSLPFSFHSKRCTKSATQQRHPRRSGVRVNALFEEFTERSIKSIIFAQGFCRDLGSQEVCVESGQSCARYASYFALNSV